MDNVLSGRSAIITGGSQGLGLAIAKAFVKENANVLICGRSSEPLSEASKQLDELASSDQHIIAVQCDISLTQDVERVVSTAHDAFGTVQILVNNAGIYGPFGVIEDVNWAEWMRTVEINLYGSVYMCRTLIPHFKSNGYGKIIQLSGGGATSPLPMISAYAVSKAAVVRYAETLAEEVRNQRIDVNAIAPGALNTRLLDEVIESGRGKVDKDFYEKALVQQRDGGVPLEKGAELAVYLASAASDGITGTLLSAVWDPWHELADHRDELLNSDIYRLRRIVPEDRGFSWNQPR